MKTTQMSFVIRLSLYGSTWSGRVTCVADDGAERASKFHDCQSMLDFIQKHLKEKSSILLPTQRSVS